MIGIKRIYELPDEKDGFRILVDRLWPRVLKKSNAHIDKWMKDIAPSADLRKWFNHEPEKWQAFIQKYTDELKSNVAIPDLLKEIRENKNVTFLYSAHDEEHNQAIVLQQFIKTQYKI